MKPILSCTLNERLYTLNHSLAQDLSFAPQHAYVFDLSHLASLEVVGENNAAFLQGQLTCDVNAVNETRMRPGGMCSLQGRLLALLDVVFWHGLHLVMPKDLILPSQQALAKTALFSRVTLKPDASLMAVGLYSPQSLAPKCLLPLPLPTRPWEATQDADSYCYAVSEELFILLFRDLPQKKAFLGQFSPDQHRGSLAWHYLELHQRRMTIYPNTRGLFLPHRLHLHTTPYLSFDKGCYKGQEIIARTHYRAKLKHQLKLFRVKTTEPIFAGQIGYLSPQKTDVGDIIDYCPIAAEHYLLAMSILSDHPDAVYFDTHTKPTLLSTTPIRSLYP